MGLGKEYPHVAVLKKGVAIMATLLLTNGPHLDRIGRAIANGSPVFFTTESGRFLFHPETLGTRGVPEGSPRGTLRIEGRRAYLRNERLDPYVILWNPSRRSGTAMPAEEAPEVTS